MPHTVAIDLGTYTLKAIQGKPGKKVQIERTVEVFNPVGANLPTDESSAEKLAQFVSNVFADHSLARADVRLALPESLVSTKIISIPSLTDAELASAITWQAEQHIPIPLDELSLEYQVLSRPAKQEKDAQMNVLMVGVRKSVIEKFLDVFLRANIEPMVLETTTLSIIRSLHFTPDDPTTLVVHTGANSTDLIVVHQGEPRFVYTHGSGGQLLTRTAQQAIQLDSKQAEQYKRTYGLDAAQLQGKMREILLPPMKQWMLEVQKASQFFASQNPGESVKRVLLSGGASQLPGLVQFVTEQLSVEVFTAAPFTDAEGEIPTVNHPAFSVCMGLMARDKQL